MSSPNSNAGSNTKVRYEANERFAAELDKADPLAQYRNQFHIPQTQRGDDFIYFAGNSLGLQPKRAKEYVEAELDDWARLGVEGHWAARHPWLPYHENLTESTARLVGAKPSEVVVMNTLTTNLHLMMVSFYRPTKARYKILIESNAFPSDQYAVASQSKFHGFNPAEAIVEATPRSGESTIRPEDILNLIEKQADSIALIVLGDVNYLTGQAFDIAAITKLAREKGVMVGLNLAHGAGNLLLDLHRWEVDFAVWCSYKYLNAGPGGLAGCFVHERHANDANLPRFSGWWGHNKQSRFKMGPEFDPIPGAEGWQLSNPPILQLAALRASMEIFDRAGMEQIRRKGEMLTGYLEYLLEGIADSFCTVITPKEPTQRGCQLSVRVKGNPRSLLNTLNTAGAICDFREPDIIRVAPAPLYNTFSDVYRFSQLVRQCAEE